jgi:putative molybdopterin biosynthesis protein
MKEGNGLRNQLKATRTRLGLSQQDLATAAGIARQTIGGIEAELYAPSAMVALRLAKALGCRVEEIFWLEDQSTILEAIPVAGTHPDISQRLTLAQIAGKWVAHPLQGEAAFRSEMIPADGVGTWQSGRDTVSVTLLDDPEALARTVVVAGCTPALSLWARSAERWFPGLRVHWMHANSMEALHSLSRGEVHAAGIHLCDPATGEYNAPFVRQVLPGRAAVLVNLGVWKEGFVVQPGNPKRLHCTADLTQKGVVLVNREEGAGSRLLLDTLLQAEGVSGKTIQGYERTVGSHQEIAISVATGQADVGVSTEAVAMTYGLGFVPLRQVRYDLALMAEYVQQEPVRQLLSTLQHRWVRSQLSMLGGYDTTTTGEVIPVAPEPASSEL